MPGEINTFIEQVAKSIWNQRRDRAAAGGFRLPNWNEGTDAQHRAVCREAEIAIAAVTSALAAVQADEIGHAA